jgi:predicted SprT family Zn-dependent metalloprotease
MNTSYVQAIIDSCFEKMRVSGSRHYTTTTEQHVRRELKIKFTTRLRTTAGICRYSRGNEYKLATGFVIELGVLFMNKTDPAEHFQLVSHELAHAYHAALDGRSNHGDKWKAIHSAMGGDAKRCHNIAVPRNRVKRFKVQNTQDFKIWELPPRRYEKYVRWGLIGEGKKYKLLECFVKERIVS